jgi:hypothetical protein
MEKFEIANPNPEFLIKSIAEQGYSLETAIADLMDNSISAGARNIEILTELDKKPFKLFITDDGCGMTPKELLKNMQFPSASSDNKRLSNDLGRFGLGMKTASFSQTRRFTVLSRNKDQKYYSGLTWDVKYLKECGEWRLIVNDINEISILLNQYMKLSKSYLGEIDGYMPNTIIVWDGLYKFDSFLSGENKKNALYSEISSNTAEYLSIVFHRFLERESDKLTVRINNQIIAPFNPFPKLDSNSKVRSLGPKFGEISSEKIKLEGFILPKNSIIESKQGINIWTPLQKSLMDMEGIYVYRSDRLILFGGWNGIIKKTPKLQLARLMVDVGNNVDHLLHLNVDKSKIKIPYDLRNAFLRAIVDLKKESNKEFHNHLISRFVSNNQLNNSNNLFMKIITNRGASVEINQNFPLLDNLKSTLNAEQLAILNFILKMCTSLVNSVNQTERRQVNSEENNEVFDVEDTRIAILKLLELGISKETVKSLYLSKLNIDTNTLPIEIGELLD